MKKTSILLTLAFTVIAGLVSADVKVKIIHNHKRTPGPVIVMHNGKMSYDIVLRMKGSGKFDSSSFTLTGMGLFPSKRGWSGLDDFMVITFDGENIFPSTFSVKQMTSGEEGSAVLFGKTEMADIQITFLTENKSDNLLINLAFTLKKKVKSINIRMQAFPGEFNKIALRKKLPLGPVETVVLTSQGESKERKRLLDLQNEQWICMYDKNYDPVQNKKLGGSEMCACGILFNPADMKSVGYKRGPGNVLVSLTMPGGKPGKKISADLAVWEFINSNKIAVETMKALVVADNNAE